MRYTEHPTRRVVDLAGQIMDLYQHVDQARLRHRKSAKSSIDKVVKIREWDLATKAIGSKMVKVRQPIKMNAAPHRNRIVSNWADSSEEEDEIKVEVEEDKDEVVDEVIDDEEDEGGDEDDDGEEDEEDEWEEEEVEEE